MDWPSTIPEQLAIRDILRARVRRVEELLDAILSATPRFPSDWYANVSDALSDLRTSLSRENARRLADAWDAGRPEFAPPAAIALAPWFRPSPEPVWSPEEIRNRSAELRRLRSDLPSERWAELASRWSRQQSREWHAAATKLLRWAFQQPDTTVHVHVPVARETSARGSILPFLLVLGVLLWPRRR